MESLFSKWQEGGSIRRRTFCYEKRFPLGEVNFIIFKGELYYEMRVPSGQGSFLLEARSNRLSVAFCSLLIVF